MQDTRHPSPEEMTAHLAKASEEGYWNHWEHDFEKHRFDWVKSRDVKNPLSPDQFSQIPRALARHQHVELCTYTYKRRMVWAYHRKHLFLDRIRLTEILLYTTQLNGKSFTACVSVEAIVSDMPTL